MGNLPPAVVNPGAGRPIFEEQRGPMYIPVYVGRKVKIYPLSEADVKNINMLSTIETAVGSIAGGVFSFLISTAWSMATTSDSMTMKIGWVCVAISIALILACGFTIVWARHEKRDDLKKILGETETTP